MAKLVLVRHGQSVWNQLNEFTGWVDVPITQHGDEEARQAGRKIKDIRFDVVFTSQMIRAHQTACLLFQERDDEILIFKHRTGKSHLWEHYENKHDFEIPVFKALSLNERYYGDLQGLNKQETIEKYGGDQVHLWRRSYDVKPPDGESLKQVVQRTVPYYEKHIEPFLRKGKHVVIVAHGNSLRSIMMHLEFLTPDEVASLELPTGVPVVYDIDEQTGEAFRKEIRI